MNFKKKCTKCNIEKEFINFTKSKKGKFGYGSWCKECQKVISYEQSKTIVGVIRIIYLTQVRNSKKRNHDLPSYTKIELSKWLLSETNFMILYNNWKNSNYDKWLRPSCDRLNNSLSYTFSNIQLVTWKENFDKECKNKTICKSNSQFIPVIAIDKITKKEYDFYSMGEGGRQLNVSVGSISKAISKELKSAGGFFWKLKKEKDEF